MRGARAAPRRDSDAGAANLSDGAFERPGEFTHNAPPVLERAVMAAKREPIHGQWSSRWVFVLAATGSAVGLGNIWRFPYLAGESGGGAFVLVYLACVAAVGLPLMIAEVLLGRRGRRSPINTMRALARDEGLSPHWQALGWMGVLAGFLILSFYSVVGGWSLAYVFLTATGALAGATAAEAGAQFDALIGTPERLLAWHTIFMGMTVAVVTQGVRGGLERAVKYLMPALFVLLLVMVGYAMGNGRFVEALAYLFRPDFSRFTAAAALDALGQAFFSLSLGMGAIMIYGSYLPAHASIPRASAVIAVADTCVALLAGMAIFPIVFAYGLQPAEGPGLVFKTLTVAFGHMPGGRVFGTLFFVLLSVAAWTSSISLLEPAVAWLAETRGLRRPRACTWAGGAAWLVGIGCLLSFNAWSEVRVFGRTVFGLVEFASANVLLPLSGLLIAVFAGWKLSRAATVEELHLGDGPAYRLWRLLVRWIAPAGVLLVFLNVLGLL